MSENTKRAPVYVTKTRLPESADFFQRCDGLFRNARLTNNGDCVRELERTLESYLGVPHLLACTNGTMALMLALFCAGLAGKKVAVTPYTYVATLSALLWLGCEPVFVDVDSETLCLSPRLLRERLQQEPDIAGVLPVHIYGLACDVDALEAICREHDIRLVYDSAQAFGSTLHGRSLLDYGDYSICSFHATKVFHTAEGGCVITRSTEDCQRVALARSFGHIDDTHYCLGINGKMSELHAAMGLTVLDGTGEEIRQRALRHAAYDACLEDLPLQRPVRPAGLMWNYAYYPVLLPDGASRSRVEQALLAQDIHSRRYFYPALTTLPYVKPAWKTACPVAEDAADRVLCLPMYGGLPDEDITRAAENMRLVLGASCRGEKGKHV